MHHRCLDHKILNNSIQMDMGWSLIYCTVVFFLLTPGILVTLPKGGSKIVVAATHAFIFAVICHLCRRFVMERFQDVGEGEEMEGEEMQEGGEEME